MQGESHPCLIESLAVLLDAIPTAFEEDEESPKGLPIVLKYSDTESARLQQAAT